MGIRVVVFFAAVLAFAGLLGAQITSRLTGSVVDTSSLAVLGATVEVYLPDGKQPILSSVTTADYKNRLAGRFLDNTVLTRFQ
jgi:hypothetical protein